MKPPLGGGSSLLRRQATLQVCPGVFQAFAELLKAGNLLVDRAKSTINYINHRLWVGTRGPGISDDLQHSAYLGKAESKIAAVGDQTEPLEIIGREISVGPVALEHPQEPDRLVVADGFHGHSGLAGRFSDSHVWLLTASAARAGHPWQL